MLLRHSQALLIHGQAAADQQGGDFVVKEPVEDHGPFLRRLLLEIAPLHVAQNLEPPGFKVVKVAGECQAGPRHIFHGQADRIIVSGGKNDLHMKFFCNRGKGNVVFSHVFHAPLFQNAPQRHIFIIPESERISTEK